MVKIRLKRVGKRKQPSYRVVVADSRSPRDGRIIEAIGHYHPRGEPSVVAIDLDRARYWMSRGAQPSNTVARLLDIAGSPEQEAAPPVTPAASVRATPAASVEEAEPPPEPEAEDEEAAAPDDEEA